jgi:hypothetical protein
MPVGVRNRHSGRAERGRSIAELQHKIEYDILINTNDIAWYTIAVTEREAVSICDHVSLIALHSKVVILFTNIKQVLIHIVSSSLGHTA